MLYRSLADLTVVVHLAFIVFIAIGGMLAWVWPRLVWLHVPAVAWGLGIITAGFTCPLTPLEKYLRRLAGEKGYEGGFVDRYLEGVIYAEELTPLLRLLAAAAVLAGYAGLVVKRQRSHHFARTRMRNKTQPGRASGATRRRLPVVHPAQLLPDPETDREEEQTGHQPDDGSRDPEPRQGTCIHGALP